MNGRFKIENLLYSSSCSFPCFSDPYYSFSLKPLIALCLKNQICVIWIFGAVKSDYQVYLNATSLLDKLWLFSSVFSYNFSLLCLYKPREFTGFLFSYAETQFSLRASFFFFIHSNILHSYVGTISLSTKLCGGPATLCNPLLKFSLWKIAINDLCALVSFPIKWESYLS